MMENKYIDGRTAKLVKDFISNYSDEFRYQLLSRLEMDCKYFLGAGGRAVKHLYCGNISDHIQMMKDLYDSFENKPDWITMDDINSYADQMRSRHITSTQVESFKSINPSSNQISIVDLVKIAYETGTFDKIIPSGREHSAFLEYTPIDRDRLIGYFQKKNEFAKEEHNESGIFSVEFISDKYDIELFDEFMKIYKIPQTERLKVRDTEGLLI